MAVRTETSMRDENVQETGKRDLGIFIADGVEFGVELVLNLEFGKGKGGARMVI